MPRNVAINAENLFIKGLITEATGLNFPENACTETFDCVFTNTGVVQRRLGIDFEEDFESELIATDLSGNVFKEFVWKNVAGLGNLTFVVIQMGDTLHFYEVSSSSSLSSNKKSFTVALTDHSSAGSPLPEEVECQFASGNGDLFVFHPYLETFYISYDSVTDSVSETRIDILIRDFEGLDDGLEDNERPEGTVTPLHKYNLFNQGWHGKAKSAVDGNVRNRLTEWTRQRSDNPANIDIWWLFKNSNNRLDVDGLGDTKEFGNTPAPKGHYRIKAFFQDRTAASEIPGIAVETSSYFRPSGGCFAFGRVFYGGVNYLGYQTQIYFSPIIEKQSQYGHCFQRQDPTSEHKFELLPTDGGVIVIPEMGRLVKMFPILNAVLVFCTNGIWIISGSEGIGFAANDYIVRKLSSVPSVSDSSFVDVDGLPFWWNNDGIHKINADPQTGNLTVQEVTAQTIKTYFNTVPTSNVSYVKGAYNPLTKLVQWLFRSETSDDLSESYQFDRVLNLNLLTEAFYPWTITEGAFIHGLVVTEGVGSSRETLQVIDSDSDTVVDGSSNNVIVSGILSESLSSSFRYITTFEDVSGHNLTFSQDLDGDYLDWASLGEDVDYDSYFVTGFKVHGDMIKKFQSNYITVHSNQETDSSCFIQGLWDYANSVNSGRWTTPQQVYPALSNYGVQRRKLKIRGQGLSLQLKFFSETGKPFNVIGWSLFEMVNQIP